MGCGVRIHSFGLDCGVLRQYRNSQLVARKGKGVGRWVESMAAEVGTAEQ